MKTFSPRAQRGSILTLAIAQGRDLLRDRLAPADPLRVRLQWIEPGGVAPAAIEATRADQAELVEAESLRPLSRALDLMLVVPEHDELQDQIDAPAQLRDRGHDVRPARVHPIEMIGILESVDRELDLVGAGEYLRGPRPPGGGPVRAVGL